jgi:Sulfite exporter TauE/SafE
MYFDAIRMPVDQFRATMSAALVAIGLVRGLGYLGLGEFTADAWLLLAITLPMTLIGIYLGNRLFAELSEMRFRRLVSLTLIVSGFALSAPRVFPRDRLDWQLSFQFACGSVLLRPSSRIIKWGLSLALGTEADRVAGNAYPSRLHRSSELDARCRYRARLAAGRHRHHSPGTV